MCIIYVGVKTDLFRSQENTPVKDDTSKSFDALQVIFLLSNKYNYIFHVFIFYFNIFSHKT